MVSVEIRRVQHKPGLLQKLGRIFTGPKHVKVGYPAGESDAGNIQKAIWNHFGTKGGGSGGGWGGPIPERPFLSNAMRNNRGKYADGMATAARAILRGEYDNRGALQRLGIIAQGDVQSEIHALSSPPNSPVTVALKGSSNPLIDTGAMRQAVTWKVE
jgi:hypothetical protein